MNGSRSVAYERLISGVASTPCGMRRAERRRRAGTGKFACTGMWWERKSRAEESELLRKRSWWGLVQPKTEGSEPLPGA